MRRYLVVAMILLVAGLGSALVKPWLIPPLKQNFDHEYKDRAAGPEEWDPGPDPTVARGADWFADVTIRSQVDHVYRNGREGERYYILESVGGGVALFDYDNDGDLDIFFPGGGKISRHPEDQPHIVGLPDKLFRNDGNLKFTDVSQSAFRTTNKTYSHGCSVCDYDNDGDLDLFVTGFGSSRLLQNEAGRFVDVSRKLGLQIGGWATASAWADFDADGRYDLFVVRYLQWSAKTSLECKPAGKRDICGPEKFAAETDLVFRNVGASGFKNVTRDWLNGPATKVPGKGLGVVVADVDGDARPDIYVANDETPNQLYLNALHKPTGRLVERGIRLGVAQSLSGANQGGMGVDAADYNNDGSVDLWVTNFELEDNALYRGSSVGLFHDVASRVGLADASRRYVGFGTVLADFDHDGLLDVVVVNGHVFYHGRYSTFRQPPQLFRGDGQKFRDVSFAAGTYFRTRHAARGLAVGDLNNDGALDLVVVHQNERIAILQNRRSPQSFLRVQLLAAKGRNAAVGARMSVQHEGRKITRLVKSGGSYLSHSDTRILLPFRPDTVEVIWPGGKRKTYQVPANGSDLVVRSPLRQLGP